MEIPEIARFCPNCGQNNAKEMKTENTIQENVRQQQTPQSKTGGFFNFDKDVLC